MKRFTIMIKPTGPLCDMSCKYCFYSDVSSYRNDVPLKKMTFDTAARIIRNVLSEMTRGDIITFAFQGGEPGLMDLDFYRSFIDEVDAVAGDGVNIFYSFQTNGLCIDDNWCEFFAANNFLIGLSLDGFEYLHNLNRLDKMGTGTFSAVMDAKKKLDKAGVNYNVLNVLTTESVKYVREIWDFILDEKFSFIQFIPCLEPLECDFGVDVGVDGGIEGNVDVGVDGDVDNNCKSGCVSIEDDIFLTGSSFYEFYSKLFPLWKNEFDKGNYISVKLFDDLFSKSSEVFSRRPSELSFGQPSGQSSRPLPCYLTGRCIPQIIVEADGSVYPCDFYVLDEYKAGNLAEESLRDVFNSMVSGSFYNKSNNDIPEHCMDCKQNHWCSGGCKRMSRAVYGKNCGMRDLDMGTVLLSTNVEKS